VSRALEEKHKTPILGLDIAWDKKGSGPLMELNRDLHPAQFAAWDGIVKTYRVTRTVWKGPKVVTRRKPVEQQIDIAHGSFDNDIQIFMSSLARILKRKPGVPVTDLSGF
jgi:hypothetical protein